MKNSSLAIIASIAGTAIVVALFLIYPLTSSPPTGEQKASSLMLVPLLTQKPEQIAKQIVEAVGDEIVSLRLNDTDELRVVAYATTKGDIIVPIDSMEAEGTGHGRIYYRIDTPVARPLADSDAVGEGSGMWKTNAMNFTRTFLER